MRLQFLPAARADLDAIFDYTVKQWGLAQAERYLRDMQATCESLRAGRIKGRSAEHVRSGYRKAASGSHMIYFKLADERLIVVRILHQSMDVERHL
ncbi:type II toxin-antitoxin system RelE/ParE family toxin [Breoghania sp. L-A4]|uniref:type II toxin-antitoxin system RelE/ParE family toxin n=1 Tax=Breoghania sp. L-A4 TaxID=2304600 RepID=UPI000E35830E|nr:type II toxin-antitoxin system RelE/ParE family toxin [Breoghania sp. L-A4]AXS41110.1 type II toxin-antitoxin system RelE/ParE family toxin [Breoghania sp. L-A4]